MFVDIVPRKDFKILSDLREEMRFVHVILDLGVYLVGSSANGFATEDTDADICIVVSPFQVRIFSLQMMNYPSCLCFIL